MTKNILKKSTGSIFAVTIVVLLVILLAADAGFTLYNPDRLAPSSPYGVLDIIRGNVDVMKKDALTWEKASAGMIIEPGTRIKTAPGAHAAVNFTGGTTTKLEPGTDLVIDRIEDRQGVQPFTVILRQQTGKTWNQVDKTGGNTSFQIRTPSADVQVHGTLFTTEIDEAGKTTVQTTEGRVSVSAGGVEVQVPAGTLTEVKPHGIPAVPVVMPRPKNELVITVTNPAYSVIKDPSGASIGYLKNGEKVNQISGSSVSPVEESKQTIRIPDPEIGDYTLTLRGITDSSSQVSVEGFVGGQSAFIHVESCNITAAKDTLLKLHYEVIAGLLQRDPSDGGILGTKAAMASEISDKTAAAAKPAKIQPAPTTARQPVPDKIAKSDKSKGFTWFGIDEISLIGRAVGFVCFVLLAFGLFAIMRRNS